MKSKTNRIKYILFLAIISLLANTSCKESDDMTSVITGPDPVATQGDPVKVTESLIFKNAIMHSGNIPTNVSGIDVELDRDTIGLVDGTLPFVGIIKPNGTVLQVAFAQVEGSDTYFEVEFEEAENDTLVYLNFEFDGTDWDYPISFNLDIAPVDDSGVPAKIIETTVIVEAPADNNGGCDIDEFLDGKDTKTYAWYVTIDRNLAPENAPLGYIVGWDISGAAYSYGMERSFPQEVSGCCTSSGSYYGNCIGFPTHALVTGVTKMVVGGARLTFFRDGSVTGYLINKLTQNVDPQNFDFCNGIPGYNINSVDNFYQGTYTFNSSNCSITIDSFSGLSDPVIGASGDYLGEFPRPIFSGTGSGSTYFKHGRNAIKEIVTSVESGDTLLVNYYDSWKYK